MTRWLDVYAIAEESPTPHQTLMDVCHAADFIFCNRRGQLKIEGCGMDMG